MTTPNYRPFVPQFQADGAWLPFFVDLFTQDGGTTEVKRGYPTLARAKAFAREAGPSGIRVIDSRTGEIVAAGLSYSPRR